ncbi:hypothetical protein TrispH2_003697 [Trichoplax sp. H2]|nr:hypothetical protein TrispH2_003697 [Trichoplax sp. H2]|eukprot:RDD43666.1 hypothetical protein TrispH2_003697 [Trichoplax sp. H2]
MADNTNCDEDSTTTKLKLPISRIRSIMKCAPEISNLSQESVYVITKAAMEKYGKPKQKG